MNLRKLFFPLVLCVLAGTQGAAQDLYWEYPVPFSPGSGSFPVSAQNKNISVIAWQESEKTASGGRIAIRLAVHDNAVAFSAYWQIRSVVGTYEYSGEEPAILSVAVDPDDDRILIAAGVSTSFIDLFVSEDKGSSFNRYQVDSGADNSVAPRIFSRADGGFLLFITRGQTQSLSLYYSRSDDGISWPSFRPFEDESEFRFTFLTSVVSLPGGNRKNGTDYLVFQSQVGTTFQLFFRSSNDGGASWSTPRLITNFSNSGTSDRPEQYNNERAHLSVQQDRLFVVWERRFGSRTPQIYGAYLAADGSISGEVQQINSVDAYCNNPVAVDTGNGTVVLWFDNSQGDDRIFLAKRAPGGGWEEGRDISRAAGGEAVFARPFRGMDGLSVFWEGIIRNNSRIYSLFPDRSVLPPRPRAENFTEGGKSRGDLARFGWNIPDDSSGISGFSWVWSKNPWDVPPPVIMMEGFQTRTEQIASEDGPWYFALRARDRAGNWSDSARIAYTRDTTPPPALDIIEPETDENGFLLSNTFNMSWNPSEAPDRAGYTWNLEYLGSAGLLDAQGEELAVQASSRFSPAPPPSAILGTDPEASYDNQDNGLWCFSVSAVDDVGNIGEPARIFFKLNKYVPHTFVTYVDARQDEQGYLTMRITGRGFSDGGFVRRVILDRDGQEPYDREFTLTNNDYQVLSDREIGGILISDIDEGLYRIVLDHPLRGLYLTPPLVSVDNTGTVKFGDFSRDWKPSWTARRETRFMFDVPLVILAAVLVFCVVGAAASARGIVSTLKESAAIRLETIALVTGGIMPSEKKKRMIRIRRKGGGLRLKLASFTVALVLLIVIMVAAPMYLMMTRTQEETLLKGLWDRSTVLLEGLAASARAYMPARNLLELGYLPNQSTAIPEARYITITGYSPSDTYDNHVLATNDPGILNKIDTAELQNGVSRLTDALNSRTEAIAKELDERARTEVGDLDASLTSFLREGTEIVESGKTDLASRERLRAISETTQSFQMRLNRVLTEIGRIIGSEPEFSTRSLAANKSETYIFFKPVLYRQSDDDRYFRGLIRLEVSIASIRHDLEEGQIRLLQIIAIVALAALALGTAGALLLSTVIIRPITRLVSHVERIRDTEDKTRLEGVDIVIRSRDELAVLGNTINDMTHGLVKAALAASDLSIGKEIQKKFIPLDINHEGNKLTSGFKDTKNVEFFGYYEGAKGVSGDYFDYQDLDGRYYAIIKCDVAGKGIPAALIMIQVATMFINYFRQWKPTEKGMHIEEVVYQINDFIETLGFKGRFAAFTLCLFDSQTGIARFCNAGDNIIHWFDASEGRIKTETLREAPATGILPNVLVESKGGYTVQTLTLDHGDILLLYTDGIEEAKRKFRNTEFREIICEEGGEGDTHENHTVGQGDEEMGADRVFAIINAVMNRQTYTLHKYHNPEGEKRDLSFDFSSCGDKVEDAIMAMVSVEKIFRMYKNPGAGENNRVLVDKKVDEFLKEHFQQYRNYCLNTLESPGNDAYRYYTGVEEDEQYDDLTILGIRRK
jgi:serine phosphatase RsbU (regulator of sigma subunit)